MTKNELLKEYHQLLKEKQMELIDGINSNSNKADIENAIDCLKCSDEKMSEYLTVIKLAYPNTYSKIIASDYLVHYHNRYFVYSTARMLLDIKLA
jgi:hypothetical protein